MPLSFLIILGSMYASAQPLDPSYLDSCERSKQMLKIAEEKMNSSGGRKLDRTSPIFEKSREECFTEPKDIALTEEQTGASEGADGGVGLLRVGVARSRLASEKMKGRSEKCRQDRDAVLNALNEDYEEKGRTVSERRDALKQFQDEAARTYMPPAQQAPTIDAMKKQIREAEEDSYKAGTAKYSMRDAYDAMTTCYQRTQNIYDTAGNNYEKSLAMTSAQSAEMASEAPGSALNPGASSPKPLTTEAAVTAATDKAQYWMKGMAVSKPLEVAVSAVGTLGAGLSKRLVNPFAGALGDIVIPAANPGGACSGAPVGDPWKQYNAGCFGVQSVGSAISILKRP